MTHKHDDAIVRAGDLDIEAYLLYGGVRSKGHCDSCGGVIDLGDMLILWSESKAGGWSRVDDVLICHKNPLCNSRTYPNSTGGWNEAGWSTDRAREYFGQGMRFHRNIYREKISDALDYIDERRDLMIGGGDAWE